MIWKDGVRKYFITPRHSIADLKNYKILPEEIQNRLIFAAAISVSTIQGYPLIIRPSTFC